MGYKVGPQFFRGLKKDGLPQVGFAVLMCVSVLLVTWLLTLMMGYNAGEAAGLLVGSQTISAVIGVAEDTILIWDWTIPTTKLRQHHSRILRRHLHFRYGRLGMGPIIHRSQDAGRAGKGESRLQGAGGENGQLSG